MARSFRHLTVVLLLILCRGTAGGSAATPLHHSWQFEGREYTWQTEVIRSSLDYYRNRPRPKTSDYSVYATDPTDDRYISDLVGVFRRAARDHGLDAGQTANFVIGFVQSLPYTSDNITTAYDEYPRYPLETLFERGGDCEDSSILAATLLKEMGYDAVLLLLPHHMAVGVACGSCSGQYYESGGKRYYYLETTGSGWQIGQLPPVYRNVSPRLLPLTAQAVIDLELSYREVAAPDPRLRSYRIEAVVKNDGSKTAGGVKVAMALAAEEKNKAYSQITSEPFSLNASENRTVTTTLSAPRGRKLKVIVAAFGAGFPARKVESEWLP